jgi:hypothetical protein
MLIYAGLYVSAVVIATIVLAASLFLVEDAKDSSFKKYGFRSTLARCAGICLGATICPAVVFADDPAPVHDGTLSSLPGVTPLWVLVALVVWFGGILGLFRKTPLELLMLFPINALFGLGIAGGIRFALIRLVFKGEA